MTAPKQLPDSYAAAWDEWDAADAAVWESTAGDGLR